MRFTFACLSLLLAAIQGQAAPVIGLTAKNFWDVTQAGPHMSSGAWLVKFYAPWCGHCKKLAPVYETVADMVADDRINVAEVDCAQYGSLCSHFKVAGYPTIIFFKDGMMYKHVGGRTAEKIADFAREDYKSALQQPIPRRPSRMRVMKQYVISLVEELARAWGDSPQACAILLLTGVAFGTMCGMAIGSHSVAPKRSKKVKSA